MSIKEIEGVLETYAEATVSPTKALTLNTGTFWNSPNINCAGALDYYFGTRPVVMTETPEDPIQKLQWRLVVVERELEKIEKFKAEAETIRKMLAAVQAKRK